MSRREPGKGRECRTDDVRVFLGTCLVLQGGEAHQRLQVGEDDFDEFGEKDPDR